MVLRHERHPAKHERFHCVTLPDLLEWFALHGHKTATEKSCAINLKFFEQVGNNDERKGNGTRI